MHLKLGHSKMSTTSDIYTMPSESLRRETVEKLGQMVTNGDEFGGNVQDADAYYADSMR